MEHDIPPDGGSHSQPVDFQATTGNPVDTKVYFRALGLFGKKFGKTSNISHVFLFTSHGRQRGSPKKMNPRFLGQYFQDQHHVVVKVLPRNSCTKSDNKNWLTKHKSCKNNRNCQQQTPLLRFCRHISFGRVQINFWEVRQLRSMLKCRLQSDMSQLAIFFFFRKKSKPKNKVPTAREGSFDPLPAELCFGHTKPKMRALNQTGKQVQGLVNCSSLWDYRGMNRVIISHEPIDLARLC